jgi:hypothetical protein
MTGQIRAGDAGMSTVAIQLDVVGPERGDRQIREGGVDAAAPSRSLSE